MVEYILEDYSKAYDFKYVTLRYFNAAGADVDCEIGEKHNPETHLIPLILDVAIGRKEDIKVFGTDYDTHDGSAIRDYIHVTDLAEAHILALEYLKNGGSSDVFNLGNEVGYSVFEVIKKVQEIVGAEIKHSCVARRAGDPPKIIANAEKAKNILGWQSKLSQLDVILKTAWEWHKCKKS